MSINNEITKEQLDQLDKILLALKENTTSCSNTKISSDDELMIVSVSNAANYVNGKENTFLKDIVHIKSSYEDSK